ncbi:MAG: copper chaperone PCu(A)C [Nostocoides sp.]
MNTMPIHALRMGLPAVLAAGLLAGCGSSSSAGSTTTSSGTSTTSTTSTGLILKDGWAKAADSGMTAAFGTLTNTTSSPIHLVAGSSPVAGMVQLHETVKAEDGSSMMKQAPDGFTLPAGKDFELKPGGNHVMLMELTAPVKVGDQTSFTLTDDKGATFEFTVPVKQFTGANETYSPGSESMSPSTSGASMSTTSSGM